MGKLSVGEQTALLGVYGQMTNLDMVTSLLIFSVDRGIIDLELLYDEKASNGQPLIDLISHSDGLLAVDIQFSDWPREAPFSTWPKINRPVKSIDWVAIENEGLLIEVDS